MDWSRIALLVAHLLVVGGWVVRVIEGYLIECSSLRSWTLTLYLRLAVFWCTNFNSPNGTCFHRTSFTRYRVPAFGEDIWMLMDNISSQVYVNCRSSYNQYWGSLVSLQYEIIDKDRFAIELLCPCGLPEVFGDMYIYGLCTITGVVYFHII